MYLLFLQKAFRYLKPATWHPPLVFSTYERQSLWTPSLVNAVNCAFGSFLAIHIVGLDKTSRTSASLHACSPFLGAGWIRVDRRIVKDVSCPQRWEMAKVGNQTLEGGSTLWLLLCPVLTCKSTIQGQHGTNCSAKVLILCDKCYC